MDSLNDSFADGWRVQPTNIEHDARASNARTPFARRQARGYFILFSLAEAQYQQGRILYLVSVSIHQGLKTYNSIPYAQDASAGTYAAAIQLRVAQAILSRRINISLLFGQFGERLTCAGGRSQCPWIRRQRQYFIDRGLTCNNLVGCRVAQWPHARLKRQLAQDREVGILTHGRL